MITSFINCFIKQNKLFLCITLIGMHKKLLFLLVKNRGQFISTELIRDYVWDNKAVGDNDIRMLIKKIRDKSHKDLIITAKGIGYKIEK